VEKTPKGWPAALLMFHLGMWRERMRDALTDLAEERPQTPPPPIEKQDEFNDTELANGIGTPLSDAAARSDHLLGEIIDLYAKVGDRPFEWYRWKTTTEAVLGNSYMHPRVHLYEYLRENGDLETGNALFEQAVEDLSDMPDMPVFKGTVLYNLACARCNQGRLDDAIKLLEEAMPLAPNVRKFAPEDPDMKPLLDDPRFQALVGG
jgi:tetratricopeptide (TPR) repeat protein